MACLNASCAKKYRNFAKGVQILKKAIILFSRVSAQYIFFIDQWGAPKF